MQHSFFRMLGIGAALAMSMVGCVALESDTAGAVPDGLYNSAWQMTFVSSGGIITVLCTTVTLQISTNQNTNTIEVPCTIKPGSLNFFTATISLLIPVGTILFTSSTTHVTLKPGLGIWLRFGSTTCDISFKSTVQLTRTRSTHSKYGVAANVGLNGESTVTPTTGICGTITTLLNYTPTAKFGTELRL